MYRQLRVGVVIPAFNETRAIAKTVATIPDFVDAVLVVDDCLCDDTSDRARVNPDVAVVMGGDGQMDPRDMPALLDPIAAGHADYVKGNRFLHPDVWREMPPARIEGNMILSAATRVPSGYQHVID